MENVNHINFNRWVLVGLITLLRKKTTHKDRKWKATWDIKYETRSPTSKQNMVKINIKAQMKKMHLIFLVLLQLSRPRLPAADTTGQVCSRSGFTESRTRLPASWFNVGLEATDDCRQRRRATRWEECRPRRQTTLLLQFSPNQHERRKNWWKDTMGREAAV